MSFHVGQKVVCVEARPLDGDFTPLKKGSHYTVAGFVAEVRGVLLAEVMVPDGYEFFKAWRFRPVIERKTDISIFTEMLTPSRHKETVE